MNFKIYLDLCVSIFENEYQNQNEQSLFQHSCITIYKFTTQLLWEENQSDIKIYLIKLLRELIEKQYINMDHPGVEKEKLVSRLLQFIIQENNQLNTNLIAILFYILAQNSMLIMFLQQQRFIEVTINFLFQFEPSELVEEILGILNLIFEILYKLIKQEAAESRITINYDKVAEMIKYFLKNIPNISNNFLDDSICIVYYSYRYLLTESKSSLSQINVQPFIAYAVTKDLDNTLNKKLAKLEYLSKK